MKSLLLVIDMQEAFINDNTKHIIPKIQNIINNNNYDLIAFTKFINYPNSTYTNKLNYTKCIGNDKEIVMETKKHIVFNKSTYTALTKELEKFINDNNIENIYLCGIDSECCVLKTAYDMFENGYNVYILENYCASIYGQERHKNAMEILKSNIGKNSVINN